jgi:hypothetical protein
MRTQAFLALAALAIGACSTTAPATKKAGNPSEPDGLACATRVAVPSIPAEYTWMRKHYPGAKVEMQALGSCDGAPADELHVRTAEGERITLFFDISSFFGKGF